MFYLSATKYGIFSRYRYFYLKLLVKQQIHYKQNFYTMLLTLYSLLFWQIQSSSLSSLSEVIIVFEIM